MARSRCWAVVPAAGLGRRMGADIPKQFMPLLGRPVLEHTLNTLISHPRLEGVVVACSPRYRNRPGLRLAAGAPVYWAEGGSERAQSVRSALDRLRELAEDRDWVLVHDAVRPCLGGADVDRLITALAGDPLGGLLALPITDTVKRSGADGRVLQTVDRAGLWCAQTPQMFRLGELRAALDKVLELGFATTDEASAMEASGHAPLLVEGNARNIKITVPADLELAAFYLTQGGA